MDKIAMITGASRGLGAALAGFLARKGYELILTARGEEGLKQIADRLTTDGERPHILAGDVSDPEHRGRLARLTAELGGLDLLINNASALGPAPLPPLAGYPLDEFERVLRSNLVAPLGLVQALLPLLRASNGWIINLSSDAARGGYAGWGGYGASKAGLDLLSATLANELRDDGITVISVDPGDMRTEMHQRAFPGEDISDRPEPETTLPFWAWLLGQDGSALSGRRFEAQSERWELAL
jgi:NAD(P)-dependent dehydrogenase (short-subunit alcohol dehydrogenase family)